MTAKNFYILQGGAEHLDYFENNPRYENAGVEFFWTCPKQAVKGDTAFVYLCAPLSRIVGSVRLLGKPFHNSGDMFRNKIMKDKWCAPVGQVKYFPFRHELTMKGLREIFATDWAWLRYPRGNCKIPADVVQPFLELINQPA